MKTWEFVGFLSFILGVCIVAVVSLFINLTFGSIILILAIGIGVGFLNLKNELLKDTIFISLIVLVGMYIFTWLLQLGDLMYAILGNLMIFVVPLIFFVTIGKSILSGV